MSNLLKGKGVDPKQQGVRPMSRSLLDNYLISILCARCSKTIWSWRMTRPSKSVILHGI